MGRQRDPFPQHTPADAHHLASWVHRAALDAAARQALAKIAIETAEEPEVDNRGRHPGDARRLRGIPAVGIGVSGAIDGTDPERELLRRERQRERVKLDDGQPT